MEGQHAHVPSTPGHSPLRTLDLVPATFPSLMPLKMHPSVSAEIHTANDREDLEGDIIPHHWAVAMLQRLFGNHRDCINSLN